MVKKHNLRVLISQWGWPVQYLGLMSHLRKEVRENMHNVPEPSDTRLTLSAFTAAPEKTYSQVYEYDIDKAYLRELEALQICSSETIKKLRDLPEAHKKYRLSLIGSLGTKRHIRYMDYGKLIRSEYRTEETRPVWDWIVQSVDAKMRNQFNEDNKAIFYWVDAHFTQTDRPAKPTEEKKQLSMIYENSAFVLSDGRRFAVPKIRSAYA